MANVIRRKLPVFGTIDDQVFVIVVGQRRIELRMAAIERDEERLVRVALLPYVVIFASVLVLVVRPSGSITFFFMKVFSVRWKGVHKRHPQTSFD